jgi:hypothetical protein
MPNTRRIKPPNENDDGSGGQWSGGLPTSIPSVKPSPRIDYDAQGGAPREFTGGSYRETVSPQQPGEAPAPKPFTLTK